MDDLIDDVSVKNDIIKVLDSYGFIKTKKGATTYSPIMRFFYNLITEGQLMQDLSKNGKATIELPEGLKDSINQNENGHWTFFNTLNQEIKLNCNFDNLEVKKAKAKLEKQNRELEKNMNKKS